MSAGRMRDSQRQKLYNAENALPNDGRVFKTIPECQSYVDALTKERWFQSRWGQKAIKVQIKPYGNATANQRWNQINLPTWARCENVILHEVAHLLCPSEYAWHGPEYAAIFLCLVKHRLGDKAATLLRESFLQHRVKYREGARAVPKAGTKAVVTKKAVAARKKAAAERPLSDTEKRQAAATLRLAVKQGLLGAPGTKQRQSALAVARALDTDERSR